MLSGRWHGSYGTVRCPAHEDRNPSLPISERDGKPLVYCHAGCGEVIWQALKDRGLVPDRRRLAVDIVAPDRRHQMNGRPWMSASGS